MSDFVLWEIELLHQRMINFLLTGHEDGDPGLQGSGDGFRLTFNADREGDSDYLDRLKADRPERALPPDWNRLPPP